MKIHLLIEDAGRDGCSAILGAFILRDDAERARDGLIGKVHTQPMNGKVHECAGVWREFDLEIEEVALY